MIIAYFDHVPDAVEVYTGSDGYMTVKLRKNIEHHQEPIWGTTPVSYTDEDGTYYDCVSEETAIVGYEDQWTAEENFFSGYDIDIDDVRDNFDSYWTRCEGESISPNQRFDDISKSIKGTNDVVSEIDMAICEMYDIIMGGE